MNKFPIKQHDLDEDSVHTTKTAYSERVLHDANAASARTNKFEWLLLAKVLVTSAALATAFGLGGYVRASTTEKASINLTPEGFMVNSQGSDVSVMGRKPLFPVYSGTDLKQVLNRRNLAEDTPENGHATLFGMSIEYYPLGTVDEKDVKQFFSHIAATGDGNAECKSDVDGFRWSYDIDLPVNGHDPSSNVFFGSGYLPDAIPYVSKPVIVVDCHNSHAGVCVVGESEATVLPWNVVSPPVDRERKLSAAADASVTVDDYKVTTTRELMKSSHVYRRRMTETFWELDEVAACWTESYDLVGFNLKGHSILAAIPSNDKSSCPKISVDAAPDATDHYTDENGGDRFDNLDKFAMVFDDLPEGTIDFQVSMPLRKFYAAVDFARTMYDGSSYDVFQNNCHVFIFDVLAYLKVPYKSNEMKNTMADYATGMIMQDDKMKTSLLKAVSDHSVGGKLVGHVRSEKSTIRFAVTKVIEGHTPRQE